MARKSKAEKALEATIERLTRKHINGVQIDIFDLGKIDDAARQAAPNGEEAIEQAIIAKVQEVRKN